MFSTCDANVRHGYLIYKEICHMASATRRLFFLLCFCSSFIVSLPVYAIDAIGFSGGFGEPNSLVGGRVALQWHWNRFWVTKKTDAVGITGYWDASVAYWHCRGDVNGDHKKLAIFAFAPVFRMQAVRPFHNSILPYVEGSIGGAYMTADHIGRRDLGARWTFQDMIGLGFQFGSREQYDLSYHFLHYSNASLASPNNGIDVKVLISFVYHFAR